MHYTLGSSFHGSDIGVFVRFQFLPGAHRSPALVALLILLGCQVDVENYVAGASPTTLDEVYKAMEKLRTIVTVDCQNSLSYFPERVGGIQGTQVSELKRIVTNSALRFRLIEPTLTVPSWQHIPFGHALAQLREGSLGRDAESCRKVDISYCENSRFIQDEPWKPSLLTVLAIHWESDVAGECMCRLLRSARARDQSSFDRGLPSEPKVEMWYKNNATRFDVVRAGPNAAASATTILPADSMEPKEPNPRALFSAPETNKRRGFVTTMSASWARCVGGKGGEGAMK